MSNGILRGLLIGVIISMLVLAIYFLFSYFVKRNVLNNSEALKAIEKTDRTILFLSLFFPLIGIFIQPPKSEY